MDKQAIFKAIRHTTWKYAKLQTKLDAIRAVYVPGMSTRDIAEAIVANTGSIITRRAIIGMYFRYRDKLTDCPLAAGYHEGSRKSGDERKKRVRNDSALPRSVKVNAAPPVVTSAMMELFDNNSLRVSLMDLGAGQCKWPVNKLDEPFVFCGFSRYKNSSYCEHHAARSVSSRAGIVASESSMKTDLTAIIRGQVAS